MQYQWNSRFRSSRRGVIGSNFLETDKLIADIPFSISSTSTAHASSGSCWCPSASCVAADVLVEESSHASVEKIESKRHFPKWATTRSDRGEYNTQHGLCRRRCGTDCNKGARVVALAMFMFDLRKRNIRVDRTGMCGVNESWKLETEWGTLTPPWIASHHIVH
jgi:hypothetical protein